MNSSSETEEIGNDEDVAQETVATKTTRKKSSLRQAAERGAATIAEIARLNRLGAALAADVAEGNQLMSGAGGNSEEQHEDAFMNDRAEGGKRDGRSVDIIEEEAQMQGNVRNKKKSSFFRFS